jgi:hypothetical protein
MEQVQSARVPVQAEAWVGEKAEVEAVARLLQGLVEIAYA